MNRYTRMLLIGTAILAVTLGQACQQTTKHKILSTLFDGVPPLETGTQEESTASAETGAENADLQGAAERTYRARRAQTARASGMVKHPPYAAKMCDGCHQVRQTASVAPMGFSLRAEKDKLCSLCHEDMSQEALQGRYRWIHGPVQYGACLECHNPHESPFPFMRKQPTVRKLCLNCHDEGWFRASEIHSGFDETECTDCHNPHGSQFRYMLTFSDEGTVEAAAKTAAPASRKREQVASSAPAVSEPDRESLLAFLRHWEQCWETLDLECYLGFYAPDFRQGARDLEAWKAYRTSVFEKSRKIDLTLERMDVQSLGETFQITALQRYRSDRHEDVGTKKLRVRREADSWQIMRETWTPNN